MSNEVIKNTPEFKSALAAYLARSEVALLLFKLGDFYIGDNKVPMGTRFVVGMSGHRIGWLRWSQSKPVETIMGFISDGYFAPARDTLGHDDKSLWEVNANGKPRNPWQPSETIPFVDETGEEFLFSTGSWGGHVALTKLQKAVLEDGGVRDPVVELACEKGKNQHGGFNFRPLFCPPVGWVNVKQKAQVVALPKKMAAEIVQDEVPEFDVPSTAKSGTWRDDDIPFAAA